MTTATMSIAVIADMSLGSNGGGNFGWSCFFRILFSAIRQATVIQNVVITPGSKMAKSMRL